MRPLALEIMSSESDFTGAAQPRELAALLQPTTSARKDYERNQRKGASVFHVKHQERCLSGTGS